MQVRFASERPQGAYALALLVSKVEGDDPRLPSGSPAGLIDASAQQQWTGAGKKVQVDLVKSFIQRLGKRYPKSSRSITVVDATGAVLAIGDARPGAGGVVKLL